MITLDNLFTFFEFIAEENTYIQHQPGTTGTTNRFSRFATESTTGQLSKLGYPRLEVVQLPFGLITDFNSSQQETLTARVRVIYKLSDKFDFDEEVTALDNAKKALFQMLNYIQTAQDECPGNSLLCAFDMNSVRYTFLDKATFSGSAVGCELSINFKKGICWEEVAYGDFPEYNGTIALPTTAGSYVLRLLNGVYSWVTASASAAWGSITGTITNQTDLVNYITTRLTGYATEAFVTSQGYITNVITSLGYTPENVANKSDSYTVSSSTTYSSTKALVDGLATKQNSLGYTAENTANKSDSYTLSSSTTYASTKALVDGLATKQNSLGYTAENTANKSDSFTASSSTTYASTKALVDGLATRSLVLLSTATASNSSSIDFEVDYTIYKKYIIEFTDVQSSVNYTDDLWLRVGTGSPVAYQSGANDYSWIRNNLTTSTSVSFSNSSSGAYSDTKVALDPFMNSTGVYSVSGSVVIYSPSNSTYHKLIEWTSTMRWITSLSVIGTTKYSGSATYRAATAITGLRIMSSTGNILTGTFKIYGVA